MFLCASLFIYYLPKLLSLIYLENKTIDYTLQLHGPETLNPKYMYIQMLLESLQANESIIIENTRLLCSTNRLSKDLIRSNLYLIYLMAGK